MKKIFLGAITLMLAMGLNTSCSENQVEDLMQTTPQVAESKSMTLDLSVAQAAGTRVEVEGIDGKDAFKVIGWSDNDQIKVAYNSPEGMNFADFFYSAKDKQFHGNVPVFVKEEDLKVAFYAGFYGETNVYHYGTSYDPHVSVFNGSELNNRRLDWRKAAPLAGVLSVVNGQVVGTLEPQIALVCVHNATPLDQDITLMEYYNYLYGLEIVFNSEYQYFYCSSSLGSLNDRNYIIKIAAGDKAYLPLIPGLSIAASGIALSPVRDNIQNGKVYKFELSFETSNEAMAVLASQDAWTWDTDIKDGCWGNFGYTPCDGDTFADTGEGIWWTCAPADLVDYQSHSAIGHPVGEEDPDAYMIFGGDGTITSYDAVGNPIHSGKYLVKNWDPVNKKIINGQPWSVGQLQTTSGSILFPYAINRGGYAPGEFEIVRLDEKQLILTYAEEGAGSWNEATFWRFKSTKK